MKQVITVLIFIINIFSGTTLSAQDSLIYYFNEYLEPTSENEAKFIGILKRSIDSWNYVVKGKNRDNTLLNAHYADSSMKIKNGFFEFYFEDGRQKSVEFYKMGKPAGTWRSWNSKGSLYDSIIYLNSEIVIRENRTYYDNDSLSICSYNNYPQKTSLLKYYNMEGRLQSEVEFVNQHETERKEYHDNGHLKYHRKSSKKGKIEFSKRFSRDGVVISEKEFQKNQQNRMKEFEEMISNSSPEYRGGWGAFQGYLQKNLIIPERLIREKQDLGKITIKFYLNKFGKAEKIEISGINDTELLRNVTLVLENMPRWDMKGKESFGPLTSSIQFL